MFQFPRLPLPSLCVQLGVMGNDSHRVHPFGDLRVKGYVPLTAAYRSLSRPSSAPGAKASTLCPYSLDLCKTGSFFSRLLSWNCILPSSISTFVFDLFLDIRFVKKICFLLCFIHFSRFMVGLGGLEPPASRLSGVRSNHLSYKPILHLLTNYNISFMR